MTAKVIFVNFVPVIWEMRKMKCIDTIQCPSLLIENEKSAVDKVLHIYQLNVVPSHNSE